jgi:hypothetical protein
MATSASACSIVVAIGFSMSRWMPRCRASLATSKWAGVGTTTIAASISSTSAASVSNERTPSSALTRDERSALRSWNPTSVAPGTFRRIRIW